MTNGRRWLLRTGSAVLGLLSLPTAFIGMAGFGEMRHQCPDGNQCVEAREVAVIFLPVAFVLIILSAWLCWRSVR